MADAFKQFVEAFNDVERCRNKCRIDKFLLERYRKNVEGYIRVSQGLPTNKKTRGFKAIAASLQEILQAGASACSCKRCESIGDAVVALDAPREMRLEHIDHSFDQLCPPLNQLHFKHPSENAVLTKGMTTTLDPSTDE
jgi:hypothetical protein